MAQKTKDIYAAIEMEVVDTKSRILGRKVGRTYNTERCIFPPAIDGASLLQGITAVGVPIGSKSFREHQLRLNIQEMLASAECLPHINTHSAYILLHRCLNSRMTYLARICEGDSLGTLLEMFDTGIDNTLADIIDSGTSLETRRLRTLPHTDGGLGLISHNSILGEKGKYDSRELTREFLRTHRPDMVELTNAWDDNHSKFSDLHNVLITNAAGATVSTSAVATEAILRAKNKIQSDLMAQGKQGTAAWYVSDLMAQVRDGYTGAVASIKDSE